MTLPFEDITWLFASGRKTRNIIRLNLEEASLLFSFAKSKDKKLEIGRRFGGSTLLLAATGGRLTSIDINAQERKECLEILKDVKLITGDSKTYNYNESYNFIFIDGDHSYNGVKMDFLNVEKFLEQDALVCFHDAKINKYGVETFYRELIGLKRVELVAEKESLVICRWIGNPADF